MIARKASPTSQSIPLKQGFTLIEVLLSLALLSLLGLMLLQWQSQLHLNAVEDELERKALLVLASLAEELRAGAHGELLDRVIRDGYCETERDDYSLCWRKSMSSGHGEAAMNRLWQLELTVRWTDHKGMVKERALYLLLPRSQAGV